MNFFIPLYSRLICCHFGKHLPVLPLLDFYVLLAALVMTAVVYNCAMLQSVM